MNNQPNDLVALEWLVLPINEEFEAVHEDWQAQITFGTSAFEVISERLHTLGGVFTVANLDVFAELAYELERFTQCLSAGRLAVSQAAHGLYASKLLQYELNRYVLRGVGQPALLRLRLSYIRQLLQGVQGFSEVLGSVANEERFSSRLTAFHVEPLLLSAGNYKKLGQAWQHSTEQLISSNQNNADALNNLKKVSDYLKQGSLDHALQCLWHISGLLLVSLVNNNKPLPHEYRFLLTELASAIEVQLHKQHDDVEKAVWIENLLVDLYVQLSELETVGEDTYEFLMGLNSTIASEQAFFPHILSVLEGVLFGLAQGEIYVEVLEDVKEQFAHRGWSFYESYAEQIVADVKAAQADAGLFAQMQWQINTQVQDLYAAISNTHEAIQNKIGQSESVHTGDEGYQDSLRKVRSLVEGMKTALSGYLGSKDVKQLPEAEMFAELDNSFSEMGMYTVGNTTAKLSNLFTELKDSNPTRISWQFAHAVADSLSMLELFLDGLARQIFDNALLTKANERIDEAHSLLSVMDEAEEFGDETAEGDVVRYDDSGEILPDIQTSAVVNEPAVQDTDDEILAQEQAELATDDTAGVSDIAVDDSQALANDDLMQTDKVSLEAVTADMVVSEAYLGAKAQLKDDDFGHDDEIREIFIEEAGEVLETLNELLPVWQADVKNFAPLTDIRRGFHTLKGSGRMVGAFNEGETAWAVENLLNRVLDGTVAATPVLANFVAETAGLIPALVKDFEQKQAPSLDPAIVVLKANNLLAGKDIDADMPIIVEAVTSDSLNATQEKQDVELSKTAELAEQDEVMAFLPEAEAEASFDDVAQTDEDLSESGVADTEVSTEEAWLTPSILSADNGVALGFDEVALGETVLDEAVLEGMPAHETIDESDSIKEVLVDKNLVGETESTSAEEELLFDDEATLSESITEDDVDETEVVVLDDSMAFDEIVDGGTIADEIIDEALSFDDEITLADEITFEDIADVESGFAETASENSLEEVLLVDDEVGSNESTEEVIVQHEITPQDEIMTEITEEEILFDNEPISIEITAEDAISEAIFVDGDLIAENLTNEEISLDDDIVTEEEIALEDNAKESVSEEILADDLTKEEISLDDELEADNAVIEESILTEEVLADENALSETEDIITDEELSFDDEITLADEITFEDIADVESGFTETASENSFGEELSFDDEVVLNEGAEESVIQDEVVINEEILLDDTILSEVIIEEEVVNETVAVDGDVIADEITDEALLFDGEMALEENTEETIIQNEVISQNETIAEIIEEEALFDDEPVLNEAIAEGDISEVVSVDGDLLDSDLIAESVTDEKALFDDEVGVQEDAAEAQNTLGEPAFDDIEDEITQEVATQSDEVPEDRSEAEPLIGGEKDTDDTQAPVTDVAVAVLPAVLLPFMAMVNEATPTVNEDMDDDIKEIFIEEAGEVLEDIIPLFDEWCGVRTDTATLTDIRRGFHTLKGSGRMVGAGEIGELAWSIENMLNRVLDGTVVVNDGMTLLIKDVLTGFGGLVDIFASGGDEYPEVMKLWAACAHAYSKGHGDEFDYRDFAKAGANELAKESHKQESHEQDDEPDFASALDSIAGDENEATESPNASRLNKSASDALTSMQEAGERLLLAQPQTPSDEEERELCEIFVVEARELLATVSQFLSENQGDQEVPVSDEIVRAFHTLRGASGLRPLVEVSEVSAIIEKSLQGLQHHDEMMASKHMEALSTAVSLIEEYLDGYKGDLAGHANADELAGLEEDKHLIENLLQESSAKEDIDVATLIDGVDELLDAELDLENVAIRSQDERQDEMTAYANTLLAQIEVLEGRTLQSSKFQKVLLSLSSAYRTLAHHPEQADNDSLIDALLNAHGELTGLFDSLAGSMSLRINESVLHTLDGKVQDIQSYYKAQAEQEASAHAKEKVLPQAPATARYQAIDTDDELLEIFLEEAGELDEAIGEEFKKWRADTSNAEALKALQRHLHTIKGGARLAGISSIGDLTHEAETVYEQLGDGRLHASSGWVNVMQDVQDLLSLQIEQVKSHKQSFFADDAVAQLQTFLNAKEVAEDTRLVGPVFEEMPVNEVTEISESTQADVAIDNEVMGDFAKRQLRSWQGNLPDDDILAVFLEEAEELVENSSESLQAFRNNTGDLASLQSLQRHLHTIKGGARMVTANGVADLAHNMETVYEDLGSRRRPATRMVTQLLMACHDWLAQAVYLLKFKLNAPRPTPLIEALELFIDNPDSLVEVPVVSMAEEIEAIHAFEAEEKQRLGGKDISRMPAMMGNFAKSEEATVSNEMIRISAGLMERMINLSGEAAINRARIDMSMSSLTASIEEMGMTVQRLHDQLRRMDIELEAQILAQIDDKTLLYEGFDPLEMDQYSSLNQLSKSLSESASDLLDIKATLLEKTRDGENLLLQLSRTQNELQDGLMNSRMVPFSRLTPRLQRIVRQISGELGKRVELTVVNADDEVDRTILERITSPLEHMLRNAMDHGIELPEVREAKGKSAMGHVRLELERVGSEILVHLTDDGAGINVEAVRKKAIAQGLIDANDDTLSDLDIMQYIFNAGLSTTTQITQISGRGVGMDVVRSEIRQLGGSVSVESEQGKGSRFTIRVPLTVAVADTLVVRAADRQYAIPLVQIERVTQVSPRTLIDYYQSSQGTLDIEGVPYRLRYLNEILSGHNFSELLTANSSLPVIIIKNQAGQNLALQVDEIVGSRIEIVVKPLGRQLSHLAGISAATIMGDGSVMLILDLMALIRNAQARVAVEVEQKAISKRPTILVVDDSVTVRKVTSRFLERQGFEAIVAKDGVDAIEMLQELTPDLMLLDIEMPRMDGFEVATQVRHNARLQDLPIIMITSRTGEKHRERAFEIGVSDYMGKPFQENELLGRIQSLLAK